MKRLLYSIAIFALVVLAACELEPQVQIAENPEPPVVLYPTQGQALVFTWDNNLDDFHIIIQKPDYGFPIKATYTAEVDGRGKDFRRSRKLGFFSGDTLTIQVRKLNEEIKKLNFKDGEVAEVDLRITSYVGTFIDNLISPVIELTYVPYSQPAASATE